MFTGIIEEIGSVKGVRSSASSMELKLAAGKVLGDVAIGDSISVNGVCLTVTTFSKDEFTADVMPETFKGTSLRNLKTGTKVNLERAMAAGGRFGGHFVNGHVDAVGTIKSLQELENALYVTINIPSELTVFFVQKGSVAIDGTSLTVFGITDDSITVSLIPQTKEDTVLGSKKIGDEVNIECDMMAKYIHRFFTKKTDTTAKKSLSYDFLSDHGFAD